MNADFKTPNDTLKIVGPEYIAALMGISVSTLKSDLTRKPESLPPRLNIPGRSSLRWVEADVLAWVNSFRVVPRGKVGRPSQVSRQSP